VFAAWALAACAGRAWARQPEPTADEGPVVIGENKPAWNPWELKRSTLSLEFLGSYRRETREQDGQPTQVDREYLARETLGWFTESSIGHKNLVDLTTDLRLRLEDRWISNEPITSDEHQHDLELLYDINAHILGATVFPLDAYARHDQQDLNRDFGTSFKQTTSEYGLIGTLQSEKYPSSIQISHNESNQEDSLGLFGYKFVRDSLSLQSTAALSDTHRLEGRYTGDLVKEEQKGLFSTDYTRHDLSLGDTISFGQDRWAELRSYLRYYEQGGLFDQKNLRWDEQLRLTHSDALESRYYTTIDQRSRGGTDQTTMRFNALVRHKLFESLVTNANAGFQRFSVSDFTSDDRFGGLSLEYTKKIEPGRLDANVGVNFNSQGNSEQGTSIAVFDEAQFYNGGLSIVVPRRNVVPGSVVVTGPGGFPVFLQGVDYTITYFPDRVEIVPIPGGGIGAGSTVFLDYSIGPEPASTIDTLTLSGSLRYTVTETWLQGLSGYVSYRSTKHDVRTSSPSLIALDDVDETLLGAEYRRWGLTLRGEQEFRQSTFNPYDTTRLQALYDARLGVNSVLSADVTDEMIRYKSPENTINFLRAGVRWRQQLSSTLDLESRVIYRNEQNDLLGNSQGVDTRVGLQWHYRQTTAYINVGYTVFGSPSSRTDSNLVEIGFRREF
jgi:hypothetical protein